MFYARFFTGSVAGDDQSFWITQMICIAHIFAGFPFMDLTGNDHVHAGLEEGTDLHDGRWKARPQLDLLTAHLQISDDT